MKSATILLLVLVCSSAFAVPSTPKKLNRNELMNKAKSFALKTALELKVNQRGVNDYVDDLIDYILKADWRLILEETLTSGDRICDIVYDTFNQVESRLGPDAGKYLQDNFEPVMGHAMGELFSITNEGLHDVIDWFNGWGAGEAVPYVVTGYFIIVVCEMEWFVTERFVDALAPVFPEDAKTLRKIFNDFDELIVEEGGNYVWTVLNALFYPSH